MSAHHPQESHAIVATELLASASEAIGLGQSLVRQRAMLRIGADGVIQHANPLFLRMLGYSLDQLTGMAHADLCLPGTAERDDYRAIWTRLQSNQAQSVVLLLHGPEGREHYVRTNFYPVCTAAGSVDHVIAFIHEITPEKQLAIDDKGKIAALQRFQVLVEFDMAGHVIAANQNYLDAMGYRLEDIKGQHHRAFVDRDEAESPAYRQFWQKLERGESATGEFARIGREGRRLWLQGTYSPILNPEGKPSKVMMLGSDVSDSRRASLQTSARLASIASGSAIMVVCPNGRVLEVNALACQAWRGTEAQLVGQDVETLGFASDVQALLTPKDWAALREGQVTSRERHARALDGSEIWLEGTATAVFGENRRITQVLLVMRDISIAKRARLDADGRLAAIDRAQAVIEFDLEGRVLEANANFLRVMGYAAEEIRGRHHRMFVEPAYAGTAEYVAFWERLSRGEFASGEYKRIANGGREVWIQATYNPVFDLAGRPIKVVKFASDVTAARLRAAEFETKINAIDMAQAAIEFDLDGHVLTANRHFLKAMGYTLREIQNQHHSMFCSAEYAQGDEYRDFWLRLNDGEFITGRFHRVGKYSRDVWIQATYNPIRDLNGKVTKVVKYAHDVTQEVMLEQRIARNATEMSQRIADLEGSIADIATNTGFAAATAQEAREAAETGHAHLQKSSQAIHSVQTSATRMAEIVRVIGDLAGQTNLLAFNAAIEAARAGEHGVGFSVVAGEVRKLAERSAQAAQEITKLIDETVRQVGHSADVGNEAARSFDGIRKCVGRTDDSVQAIAKAAESQRQAAVEVVGLIAKLTSGTSA